jgi:hypothetical protein
MILTLFVIEEKKRENKKEKNQLLLLFAFTFTFYFIPIYEKLLSGRTPLTNAIRDIRLEEVKALIKFGANIKLKDYHVSCPT